MFIIFTLYHLTLYSLLREGAFLHNPLSCFFTFAPTFFHMPPYIMYVTGSMDQCGPMTVLVLCAVPGNKWLKKKKKQTKLKLLSMAW